MATQSKAQFLNEVHTQLKRRYKPKPDRAAARLTVLEAVVYGICHEDTTREQANQALSRFKDDFFDWNEVRVSTIEEIQSVLAGLPDPEDRAQRIRRFLRQLFEKTYGFTLEPLTKKPLKEAVKVLQEYEAFSSNYVMATVIHEALGGHAIPVGASSRRVLERLGITDPESDNVTLRSLLERAVPKNRGSEFVDLIEDLAYDTCVETNPDCPRCELRKVCPTSRTRKEEAAALAKVSKDGLKAKENSKKQPKPAPIASKGVPPAPSPAKAAKPAPSASAKPAAKPMKDAPKSTKQKPGGAK
jgi:endonuclease III